MGTLLSILQLLPAIFKAVQTAEEYIPIPGQGKAKLDFVLGVVQDTYAEASKIIPQITAVISRVVGLFNSTGVFKKA